MRTKDLDALMGIAAMPKLTDQLAMAATSFSAAAAEQAKLVESVAAKVGASIAGLDRFRDEALMTSRWAQDIADQQAALHDSVRSAVEAAQVSQHLATYSKLLPEWKAIDWGVIDGPLLRQMADQARRQIEFFDQLGLMSREAAARSEIFCPRLDPPIAPQAADPDPVLAEFVEAQGEAQLTLGKLALRQGMWVEAESHFTKAVKWLVHSAEPYVGLGFALNAQGEHQRAVKAFERAERRDPVCCSRPDVRAAYEASLQGRRWDGQLDSDSPKGN